MIVGIVLGVLIGILSGAVFTLLLWAAVASDNFWSRGLAIVGEILALPIFWFGGPWVTTQLLKDVKWEVSIHPYMTCLGITFVIIVGYPLARLIIRVGRDLQK